MAQTVKNLPAMQKTQVLPLVWEAPLEKGVAIHSSILAWRTSCTGAWRATVHGVTKSRAYWATNALFHGGGPELLLHCGLRHHA